MLDLLDFLNSRRHDPDTADRPDVLVRVGFDGDCHLDLIIFRGQPVWSVLIGNGEMLYPLEHFLDAVWYLYHEWYLPEHGGPPA